MANSMFHHEEIYRGKDLVKKLGACKITVCGAGALGSNLVDNLTRQGFSSICVIDKDRVELHNLNNQYFGSKDVGSLKADALKNIIFRNVEVEIDSFSKELTESNTKKFLKGSNLIVDVFDNSSSRRLVQEYSRISKIPCLHGGLNGEAACGEIIWDQYYCVPQDVAEGDACDLPLARNLVCLVVSIVSEEIIDFCLSPQPRLKNWSISLKDLSIRHING